MSWGAAFVATILIEVPLWAMGLAVLRLCGPVRAVVLGVCVNVVTHPVLWHALAPSPRLGLVLAAEACVVVVEAALVRLGTGRSVGLAAMLSLGVNAASFGVGVVVGIVTGAS